MNKPLSPDRRERLRLGATLREVAAISGYSFSHLAMAERGEAHLSKRARAARDAALQALAQLNAQKGGNAA